MTAHPPRHPCPRRRQRGRAPCGASCPWAAAAFRRAQRAAETEGGLNSTECRFDAYSLHAPAQAESAAMVLTRHHKSIAGQQICGQRQGAERLGRKSYVDDILKRGTAVQDKARASTWAGVNEFFARTANESSALVSSVDPSRRRVDFNHYT